MRLLVLLVLLVFQAHEIDGYSGKPDRPPSVQTQPDHHHPQARPQAGGGLHSGERS
jgi:hypothetical protein